MTNRGRRAIVVALLALFVAGASMVFLIGSSNRRADREAVLRYEAAVTAQVREMIVVAGSLAAAANAFEVGRLTASGFTASATQWQKTLTDVAERIDAVRVPAPFGIGREMFAPAAREFAKAAGLYASFAACAQNSVGPSAPCIATATATTTAEQALALYRSDARVLQDTRKRLDLDVSANFPENLPR